MFCSSVTAYLKLDSKGTQGNELYIGGWEERDQGSYAMWNGEEWAEE